MAQQIDSEAVIEGLTVQVGQLTTQVIMRDVALRAAEQEIAALKASATAAAAAVKAPKPKPA